MKSIKLWVKIMVLAICFSLFAEAGYAIMPPDVYKKAIQDSPVKALAKVLDVVVTEKSKYYICKRVKFKLVKSYGLIKPSKIFYGHCKSATDNKIVGGTIYYYPEKGDEVFVTLDGVGIDGDAGYFTSFTLLDDKLRNTLIKIGLDGLDYGFGKVTRKN